MSVPAPKNLPGIALLCDADGVIEEVIRDQPGLHAGLEPGRPFTALVDSGSVDKARRFLKTLRRQKMGQDWELNVPSGDQVKTLNFAGGLAEGKLLIIGAATQSEVSQMFEEMTRINNEQANALRTAFKEQTLESRQQQSDPDFYEQLSQLNNELANAQRELAKKNAELEKLYAIEKQRTQELNALYQATTALLSTLDLEELLDEVLTAALNAIPAAEEGALLLEDSSSDALAVQATGGCAATASSSATPTRMEDRIQEVIDRQEARFIRDLQPPSEAGDNPRASSATPRSALIAPLSLSESELGALIVCSSKPQAFDELKLQLLRTFAATATAAIRHAQLYAKVQHMATTDPLTGLHNRRGLFTLGRHEVERARRFEHPLTALMLDLDHFKELNDTHGHKIGDEVLTEVAERCQQALRQADLLGRYGGEEFAVLLPETDLESGRQAAERLRQAVADSPIETSRGPHDVTISVGVAALDDQHADLEALFDAADRAMYAAKKAGRNRVRVWRGQPAPEVVG